MAGWIDALSFGSSPARLGGVVLAAAALLLVAACSGDDGGDTCKPLEGQCPNICNDGTGVESETCTGTADCQCGLFCKENACAPYEGANAGCACGDVPPTPDATGDGGGEPDEGPEPDGGVDINNCSKPAPAGAVCNPYCQLGCAEDEQCAISDSKLKCMAFDPAGGRHGDDCTSSDECRKGLSCMHLEGETGPNCKQPCLGDDHCPPDLNMLCNLSVNFGSGISVTICQSIEMGCDPFADPSTCGADESCYYTGAATTCEPAGTLAAGEVCDGQAANICGAGLHCLVHCTEVCSTGAGQPSCGGCANGSHEVSEQAEIGICLEAEPPATCDIFAQNCSGGKGCVLVQGGVACRNVGTGAPGAACGGGSDCQVGTLCVNGQCHEVCSQREGADAAIACADKCGESEILNLAPDTWGIGVCAP